MNRKNLIEKIKHKNFKIGVWSLEENTFRAMKNLNKKTKETNLEHGGLLCGNFENKKIKLEQECVGTKCEIPVYGEKFKPKKCKDGYFIGVFHTHPMTSSPTLSLTDIKNFEKDYFGCLGTPNNNKIICHRNRSNSDEYWNNKRKEEYTLNKMLKLERELHQKRKEERSTIDWNLPKRELNKELKKYTELKKYSKYYQNTFLKKVELTQ